VPRLALAIAASRGAPRLEHVVAIPGFQLARACGFQVISWVSPYSGSASSMLTPLLLTPFVVTPLLLMTLTPYHATMRNQRCAMLYSYMMIACVFESKTLNHAVEIDVPESKIRKGETVMKSYFKIILFSLYKYSESLACYLRSE
jgi:hypothetical protein